MFYCFTLTSTCRSHGNTLNKCNPFCRLLTAQNRSLMHITCSDQNRRCFLMIIYWGQQGCVGSCSLKLLSPLSKLAFDKASPCTWHLKVNRLFNSLSWHVGEVWARCTWLALLKRKHLFICSEETEKKSQEAVKLVPQGQVYLMCHAALKMCSCKWNKDTHGRHWP